MDVVVDEAYNRLQSAGHETYKQTLARHHEFWRLCEGEWAQGKGYRDRVRDRTDDEFETDCDDAKTIIRGLIAEEWQKLITLLRGILEERPVAEPTVV